MSLRYVNPFKCQCLVYTSWCCVCLLLLAQAKSRN